MLHINALYYGITARLLLCTLLLIVPKAIIAKQLPTLYQWPIDEESFVIINVRVNGRSVVSDLEAYYSKSNKLLLPISGLKSTMGISLNVSQNTLSANVDSSEQVLNAELSSTLAPSENVSLWAVDDYDHYVDLSVINTLLNTDSRFDYSLMQVSFSSNLLTYNNNQVTSGITKKIKSKALQYDHFIDDQYQALTYPVSEYSLSASYKSSNNRYKGLLRLNSYFDLFHHRAELRFNKNENTANTFLKITKDFNLSEQDHSLARIHYQLGDIQSQSDQLITSSNQGRGFYISNANPHSAQNFSTITIEEPALPGWQAELHRNGQFIATTQANDENLVRFTDVETFYGNNIFEIKLFGSQGEQITRTQKYTIGQDALSPGKISYQVEFLETDKSVFNQSSNSSTAMSNAFKSNLSYGISEFITYDAQITHLQTEQNNSSYLSSGLNTLTDHGSYRFLATKQLDAGYAYFAGFRGLLSNKLYNDINVNVEYSALNNFSSALFVAKENSLKNRLSLSLNGRTDFFNSLNWNMRWNNEVRKNTNTKNRFSLGINKSYVAGTWSSQLFYDDDTNNLINRLYSSIDIASWKWTNTLDWQANNGAELTRLRSSLRWPQTQSTFNQTQLTYQSNSAASTLLNHQYTYRHEIFNIQVSGQVDNQGDWRLSLGLNGTFSFDHLEADFNFDTPRSLNSGQIEVSSFIDWNENEIFDQGDEPIQDVNFTGNYLWRDKYTNNDGKVLLPSSYGGQVLDVNLRSLSNPYLQPSLGKIKTLAHRGGQTKVNIPLVVYNEVEGTIYLSSNEKSKPIAGLTVVLKEKDGEKHYSTVTEYDGYYYFPNVSQGNYILEIEKNEQLSENITIKNLPEQVITEKSGDTIILQDIIVYTNNADTLTEQATIAAESNQQTPYFVQLGVFKKFQSALTVANKIDKAAYALQLYKHERRDSYYLVAGPYNNAAKAQQTINDVYSIPALHGSFMVDARRYVSPQWRKIGEWSDMQTKNTETYFCQYGAYTSKKSVNKKLLRENPSLFIAERAIKGKAHYLMLSGPHNAKQTACDTQVIKQIKGLTTAIKKPWHSIFTINQ